MRLAGILQLLKNNLRKDKNTELSMEKKLKFIGGLSKAEKPQKIISFLSLLAKWDQKGQQTTPFKRKKPL